MAESRAGAGASSASLRESYIAELCTASFRIVCDAVDSTRVGARVVTPVAAAHVARTIAATNHFRRNPGATSR